MAVVFNIFIIFLTLFLLIGFHELGHFWAARRLGISVGRFAIGFGKPVWIKKAQDGTEYAVCAFPIGGYVSFKDQAQFDASPLYKRFAVILAGPLFNLIFAFLAYWGVYVMGVTQVVPQIDSILPNSMAFQSGLHTPGEITAIDHHHVSSWGAVLFRLIPHLGRSDTLTLSLSQQGHLKDYAIQLQHWKLDPLKPDILGSLGVVPVHAKEKQILQKIKYPPFQAVLHAVREVGLYLEFNAIVLWKVISGVISLKSLAGPLTLLSGSLKAASGGFVSYTAFLGFISVGLAFINLLPIPGLDGAYLVFLGIEGIRKKPLSKALQVLLLQLGIIILVVLMIQALMNDLVRLF